MAKSKTVAAPDAPRRIIVPEDLKRSVYALKGAPSKADVKKLFALPATLGTTPKVRAALDSTFSKAVGFDSMLTTLTDHASRMGQFPVTSFVGYGALQQIAQNGMVRNCIKTVADDVTREWITIKGGSATPPERIEELQSAQQNRYRLQDLFNDAIAKVGFMGGAFVFIKTPPTQTGDEQDLSLPLRLNSKSSEIEMGSNIEFIVVDPVNVTPGNYNSLDPLRADYMKPTWWYVLGKKVHGTRMLPLYANEPPTLFKPAYNFLGVPQAQILWDYVLHWNECRVYAQDLIKKMSLLVYYTNMQDRMASPTGVQELDAVMSVLQHYRDNNSVFAVNTDTDRVENVQVSISGVSDIVRQSQEMIAAVNRTPAVKLFGISPSGFNATGESDIRNYNDHLRSQQELYRPAIQECLKAIQLSLWGEIDPEITFEWNEVDIESEGTQAANFNARVMALAGLKDRNAISAEEMRQAVRLEKSSHLEFLPDELPPDADEDGELSTDDGLEGILSQFSDVFGSKSEQGEVNEEEDRPSN